MSWPIAVSSFGPVEAGTLLWTQGARLHATLVLRTAFALMPGVLAHAPAGGVERVERHFQSDETRPVRTVSDLAPRIPRAEVVHVGGVIAPAGITMVRLALLRQGKPLFDKRGMASTKNDSPGLGPLGPASPERRASLKGHPEPRSDGHGRLVVSEGFDFGFYQSAPADQQVDALVGGDQILLGNLHPDLAELAVVVPNRAPVARAVLGDEEAPLPVTCKRVILDTDRRVYTLLWYGDLEIPSAAAVPYLRLEARAPELAPPTRVDAGQMLQRIAGAPPRGPVAPAAAGPQRKAHAGTLILEDPPPKPTTQPARKTALAGTLPIDMADVAPPATSALPFRGAAPATAQPAGQPGAAPGATPWAGAPLRAAPKLANPFAGTLAIDEPVPEQARPPPPPAPPPPEPVAAAAPPAAKVEQAKEPIRADAPDPRASPWAPAPAAPRAPAAPAPPPKPKGPAAANASLKKDSNERFRKR